MNWTLTNVLLLLLALFAPLALAWTLLAVGGDERAARNQGGTPRPASDKGRS